MIDLLNPKPLRHHSKILEEPVKEEESVPEKRSLKVFNWFRELGNRKFLIGLALTLFAFPALIYLLIISPAVAVYTKVIEAKEPLGRLQTALNERDLVLIDRSLQQIEVKHTELKKLYRQLGYLEFIPIISDYYQDGKHLLEAVSLSLEGGKIVLEATNPFGNVLGLVEGFEGHLTTEEHIANLASVLPQTISQIDAVLGKLFLAKVEFEQIDPSRYPEDIGGVRLRFWLGEFQKIFSELDPFLIEAKPILKVLPSLLGVPKQTYLTLFQNDAELRATGGFITSIALITVENGRIVETKFHAQGYVNNRVPWIRPPEPLRKYLRVSTWYFADANFSPDFKTTVERVLQMWRKTNLPEIHGVVAINTRVGERLLEFIGPVKLSKYALDLTDYYHLPSDCRAGKSSLTAANLVCRLEFYVEKRGRGTAGRRKAILNDLMEVIIKKITASSLEIWPQLVDLAFELLEQKDIILYSTDKGGQGLIERLDFAGQIKDYESDYLHISDSNFGGKKTDLYMQETVEQSLVKLKNGKWRKTVKINYYNPQKHDNWLSANYKNFVRIYVPRGSKLIEIRGANREWGSWTELKKTVFGAYFTLWPQKKHTLTFIYDLPAAVVGENYQLLMQKQPGTNITLVKVKIDGKMKSFDLETDREIEIALE